jgi:hypothetical protein
MSILNVKPHKISRDLRGYSVFFYGSPKSGKTTIASQFPGALILGFEKGWNALPGVMAYPLNSWGEFKKVLNELKTPEAHDMYQTMVIDTADIAYHYCEKYICAKMSDMKNSYDSIAEIPFGKGFKLAQEEFDECIRKIIQMDYGLVLISHSQDKTFKDEQDKEYSKIIPTLDQRARLVCERTCDIIGYSRVVDTDNGPATKLFLRETPRFVAGSRFKHLPPVIDFNYDSLVNAIGEAVEKEGANQISNEATQVKTEEVQYDFPAMMEEFQNLVGNIMQSNPSAAIQITNIVNSHLGTGKKVADCTPEQAPQLDLILFEIKQLQ